MTAQPTKQSHSAELEKQRQHDVAHHTLRITWLAKPDARWADGEPVLPSDRASLTIQSEQFLKGPKMWTRHCSCEPRCELPEGDAQLASGPTGTSQSEVLFVFAKDVRIGDVLRFANSTASVNVERITSAQSDGSIGLHGNDDTWTGFYQPQNRVRIAAVGTGNA